MRSPRRPALALTLGVVLLALAGCGDRTAAPGTEPATVVASPTVPPLPEGLDLTAGLPLDDGDVTVTPQAPDGDGVGEIEMCGEAVWPVDLGGGDVRRLVAAATGPEWFEGREVLAYADAEAAQQVLAPVREAARTCRRFDIQVWTPLAEETGHDSVTMGLTYTDGLGSSVFQVTRVGAAVLLVTTYGEGTLSSLPDQAAGVTATTRDLARQLCVDPASDC